MRVFTEEQRFNQWWFVGLMILVLGISVMTLFIALPETNSEEPVFWVLIGTTALVFTIALAILFLLRLETRIDEQGVHYAFKPFHRSLRLISWHDMSECFVRKYSPIGEYGGWGYRVSFGKKGKALNVKGNIGIQIVNNNGKRLLLGTQKEDEARRTISNYLHKL